MTTLFTAGMYYYGFSFMMGKGSVCCGQAGVYKGTGKRVPVHETTGKPAAAGFPVFCLRRGGKPI